MKLRTLVPSRLSQSFLLAGFLTLALPALFSGCVVVAAGAVGAGAVAYVRGELKTTLPHRLDDTHAAAQRALAELGFARINDRKTSIDAELVSRTALDKKVRIELERVANDLTEVRIRVGLIGDQGLSLTVLDKIKAELD